MGSISIIPKIPRDLICHKMLYWDSVRMQPKNYSLSKNV